MKNLKAYIAIFFVITLSLLPPIDFYIKNFSNDYWTWVVCIAGFFGCLTIFLNVNIFVKIIAISGFINCFFSIAPYISFTSYISLVGCCYLYIFCCSIRDWCIVIKMIQAVAVFNCILLILQFFGHDQLLNFGGMSKDIDQAEFGGIGQHMRMGSFSVILTSLLIFSNPWWCLFSILIGIFCKSAGAIVAVSCGTFFINKRLFFILLIFGIIFSFYSNKFHQFGAQSGRLPVWEKTIELANKRPLCGIGIGTYKLVFAPLARLNQSVWKTAHNCWLQILFECGYPGLILSFFMTFCLFHILWKKKDYLALTGLVMISTDMMFHFPTRMMNTVPLIILFLAFCEQRIKYGHNIFKNNIS